VEPEDPDKKLNLYMRYATAHEKSFYTALKRAAKAKKRNSKLGNWLQTGRTQTRLPFALSCAKI
jgi:hypothetical protein